MPAFGGDPEYLAGYASDYGSEGLVDRVFPSRVPGLLLFGSCE